MKKRVLLGMSGGVDSSASAILLKKAGYDVIGCTMKLWNTDEKAIKDAKKVCEKLQIPHYIIDCEKEFRCKVIDNFINEYQKAKTPNPCVQCNKYIKFGEFYKRAQELECDFMATGHYARIEYSNKYNQYVLRKSKEEKKDQTYFLYTISPEKIEHILFPLQDYIDKQDTRKIAEENQLEVAQKKDSQEICFIPNNNYQDFLLNNMNLKPKQGNIVLKTGEVLGKHNGLINYTIGQRKGLGVSYKEPLYVINLDKTNNQVVVGKEEDLYSKELRATDINWIIKEVKENIENGKEIECYAKIRYRAKEAKAIIKKVITKNTEMSNYEIVSNFVEPQRAITPGQSVVFYDDEGIVLGGGTIM